MPPHQAPAPRSFRRAFPALLLSGLLALAGVSSGFAQSTTGVVTGRIYNPATGEYLRNATVRIKETGQSAVSEDGGRYRISSVPAGPATITVNYTGFHVAEAQVNLPAGETVERDFALVSSLRQAPGANDPSTIELERYVVVADVREGSAKAIMDQRNSMNITNTVSSDMFGDVAEGNVGEFLKHLPGVSLNLVEGEVRTVSLRGLGAEYTRVTLDGMSLASADANSGAAGDARAFGFEQASLNSMEAIEVSKTISADVDANAPAGTINLRTKRAFDRAGRRITVQANATAYSRELTLSRTPGPDDNPSRKIRGGGIFEYSDVFLDKRLGVVLNVSESNVYSEITHNTVSYNTTTTARDTRPAVPTQFSFFHGPRTNRRAAVTLTTDYRLTPELTLSLKFIRNESDLWFFFRNQVFRTGGTRSSVVGADPLVSFTTSSAGSVTSNPIAVAKVGDATTWAPKFEFKRGNLTVEGRFAFSDSVSTYTPQARGAFRTAGGPTANGVTFTATRSNPLSSDWRITQVAGPDLANGANFTAPSIETEDGRFNRVKLAMGDVTASLKTTVGRVPVVWKAGVKKARDTREFELTRQNYLYTYTGPGAGLGAWRSFVSPFPYDLGAIGASATSVSGGRLFYPNLLAMFDLYRQHPENFTRTQSAANYYNANIANKKHYVEDIDAAFLMGTAKLTRKVTLRAGLRWEQTSGDSLEFDPRAPAEVTAAGYPVSGGRATTIDGLRFQYESRPRVHRTGRYDNLFPSASLKYEPWRNLDIQLGYSSTIRRPTFRAIAGVWTINDESLTVSAPNPNLLPEESDNFSLRTAYYFEPVGIFAMNLFQNNVQGLHRTTELSAQEYGYDGDLDLSSYRFSTTVRSAQEVTIRGFELEYSQSLSFLPGALRGLNVRASYTRNYADVILTGMSGHGFSAGVGYTAGRFNVYANGNWQDDRPTNITNTNYVRHRANLDLGGSARLSDRITMFFIARNVLDEPYLTMLKLPSGGTAALKYEKFGTNFTLGVKGVF